MTCIEVDLLVRVDDHGYSLNGAGFKFAMRRAIWHHIAELQSMGFSGTFQLKGSVDDKGTTEKQGSSKAEGPKAKTEHRDNKALGLQRLEFRGGGVLDIVGTKEDEPPSTG